MDQGSGRHRTAWTWFDLGLAALAVVTVGLLALSLVRPPFGQSAGRERLAAQLAAQAAKVEGEILPGIPYFAPNSTMLDTVDFSAASATLVLAFASTCGVCEANYPNWLRLQDRTVGADSIRVLGVVADANGGSGASWLAEHGIRTDRIVIPAEPMTLRSSWHVLGVPATYVVDRAGRVMRAKFGALSRKDVGDLLQAISQTNPSPQSDP
jgi:hypothetical protein